MLGTETETELFLFLDLDMNEEKACEHSQHNIAKDRHGGPAKWYLRAKCPDCTLDIVYAACDPIKRDLMAHDGICLCAGCGHWYYTADYVSLVEEIK